MYIVSFTPIQTENQSFNQADQATFQRFKVILILSIRKKVQVGKDQEKAQSERDSHSKNRGGEKTKLTIRHLYHETYRKPNEQLFSQKVATQLP